MDGLEELPQGLFSDVTEVTWDLEMIVAVVVEVKYPDQLSVCCHYQVLRVLDTFAKRLSSVLLHLDVVKLPEIGEPFDELRRIVLVKLDIREEGFKHGR